MVATNTIKSERERSGDELIIWIGLLHITWFLHLLGLSSGEAFTGWEHFTTLSITAI